MRPGIVHRLDKGTSGVMVIAKNDDAHKELARQFHDREVEKEYVALAWGLVQQRKRINAAIGRDPKNRVKMSMRAGRARHAVTRVTWSRDLKGVTLLRVAIATGRTHQIRVHLSAIGHPIVGDALYGGVHRRVPHPLRAVTKLTRPFLHAERLVFTHPRTRALEFTRRCRRSRSSRRRAVHADQFERPVLRSILRSVSLTSLSASNARIVVVDMNRRVSIGKEIMTIDNGIIES